MRRFWYATAYDLQIASSHRYDDRDMRTHQGLALAVASSLLLCCDSKAEVDPEIARLPQCVIEKAEEPRDWQTVESPRGELTVELPPEFVATGEPQGVHGGQGWRHRDRKVRMTYGYWSMRSFPSEIAKCRLSVRNRYVVFVDYGAKTGTLAAAWLVASGAGEQPPYDVVLGFSSPRASDRKVFETILQTADY